MKTTAILMNPKHEVSVDDLRASVLASTNPDRPVKISFYGDFRINGITHSGEFKYNEYGPDVYLLPALSELMEVGYITEQQIKDHFGARAFAQGDDIWDASGPVDEERTLRFYQEIFKLPLA